jgi:hypothetical protein
LDVHGLGGPLEAAALSFRWRTEKVKQRGEIFCVDRSGARATDREQDLFSGRTIGGFEDGMGEHAERCASFHQVREP